MRKIKIYFIGSCRIQVKVYLSIYKQTIKEQTSHARHEKNIHPGHKCYPS